MKKSKKKQLIMNMIFRVSNLWQQKGCETDSGLTLRQFMLLATVRDMPEKKTNLSALSEAFGGSRQNVRQLVSALTRKEFLHTEQSAADKRETLVSLTDKAAAYFSENENAGEEIIRPVFAGIGEKTLDGALECLEKMIKNLDADEDNAAEQE